MNDTVKDLNKLLKHSRMRLIIDFDYTITTNDSNSSIGVFSNYLPSQYVTKKKKLDFLTKMIKLRIAYKHIWKAKLKLLKKYNAENVLESIDYQHEFKINYSVVELIKIFVKNNCKIIIYSSGIKEIILRVLRFYNLKNSNIEIIANSLNCKSIITPYKKRLHFDENILLIGDKKHDLNVNKSNYIIQVINNEPIVVKWGV